MMKNTLTYGSTLLLPLLFAAGCAVGPVYERPGVDTPAAYKEVAQRTPSAEDGRQGEGHPGAEAAALLQAHEAGAWKAATPAEAALRGEWWTLFEDEILNALQAEALIANQSLHVAAARLTQARALQRNARSERMPTVDAGFGPNRQRPSPASQGLDDDVSSRTSTLWRAQATVGYEVDLFGRVAASVDAATADTQQSEALYRSVLLALQADVAQTYFLLREYDAEAELFRQTVVLRAETLQLVQRRYNAGDISELDLARARTELAAAQSQALGVARNRSLTEHALAVLLGKPPAGFSMPPQPLGSVRVAVPAGLPSELLERRPDIAAAERAMAAANARVGMAHAAFFPRLEITGALGYESSELNNLLQWSTRTFVLGPLVGTALTLPLFDGGKRQAGLERARAVYEENVAQYRHTVLNAFREVEDALASLRILANQTQAQNSAVDAAARAARISHTQYREGSISYLDVIDSDRSVLAQQRTAVQLNSEQARSAVALIRALGGGWDIPLPDTQAAQKEEAATVAQR